MRLFVKNRQGAETANFVLSPHIIISIFTPGDEPPRVAQNSFTRQVIQLAFDDLDNPNDSHIENPVLFSDEDADEIAKRVQFWKERGVGHIICHCDAGISRSAGMAAAIAFYYNGDDSEFFNYNRDLWIGRPLYRPNMRVYRKMTEALNKL